MSFRNRFIRFMAGLALLLIVLITGFSVVRANIPTWGATPAEVAQKDLPGDEFLPNAPSSWVNAVTIDAPPEAVWPWISQIGDTRGGFYSYMFIERLFMRAIGPKDADPNEYYVNANTIHPEWQNPPIGESVILNAVLIHEYEPERYMLVMADPEVMAGMGWTWLWHLTPTADGRTRLVIHLRTQPPVDPNAPPNPVIDAVVGAVVDLGGFVMEKAMLDGIKLRAEGGSEPAWIETAEIFLWLAALAAGAAAGWLYLTRPNWQRPLLVALLAVIVLFIFTYLQPALWLRVLIDLALFGGVAWAAEAKILSRPAKRALAPTPAG
jgi:hypothetical protein